MKVAIYGSRRQQNYIDVIDRMLHTFACRGVEIVMASKLYRYLCDTTDIDLSGIGMIEGFRFSADIAISIGGDGTFLRTARWVGDKEIPIVGVNTGHLGYLAAFSIADMDEMIEDIIAGNYSIERRSLLKIETRDGNIGAYPYALNEVALIKTDTASMISSQVSVNGAASANYQADGLIISTPTGSTGYNLSVGGPIIEPTAPVFVISPIAAHALTMRPLVVADSSVIAVTATCRATSFLISLDGRSVSFEPGAKVTLRRAPFDTLVIQRRSHAFTDTLRNKLRWGL